MDKVAIKTERFRLRSLEPTDATPQYLGWLHQSNVLRFISAAPYSYTVHDLAKYIEQRVGRCDVLFLGIFAQESGEHVGNIKYEPIDVIGKYAVMGILIGEPTWRGRGVAAEVISASALWLAEMMGIQKIILGVSRDNLAAIKAYEKVGFRHESTDKIEVDPESGLSMVWHL